MVSLFHEDGFTLAAQEAADQTWMATEPARKSSSSGSSCLTTSAVLLSRLCRAMSRDQTQRLLHELRVSEANFRLLAENIQDVFWISTPTVDRITYVSPAFESIWGRTCESLYQQPQSFVESIHAEDRGRVTAALWEHAQGNWDLEYRLIRPDGSVRWIHDRGFPIRDERGKLIVMCGVARDIMAHGGS